MVMRVLVIDGFEDGDPVVDAAIGTLRARGHEVDVLALARPPFPLAMSEAEHRAYPDEGENLLAPETREAAALVRSADALLFCCPTVAHSLPARVKGFLDRVFVTGVAFTFDDDRFVPKLRHIRRIGLVTRHPHGRVGRARARDGARRTILRTIRLHCAWTCRRTHVVLRPDDDVDSVSDALRRW